MSNSRYSNGKEKANHESAGRRTNIKEFMKLNSNTKIEKKYEIGGNNEDLIVGLLTLDKIDIKITQSLLTRFVDGQEELSPEPKHPGDVPDFSSLRKPRLIDYNDEELINPGIFDATKVEVINPGIYNEEADAFEWMCEFENFVNYNAKELTEEQANLVRTALSNLTNHQKSKLKEFKRMRKDKYDSYYREYLCVIREGKKEHELQVKQYHCNLRDAKEKYELRIEKYENKQNQLIQSHERKLISFKSDLKNYNDEKFHYEKKVKEFYRILSEYLGDIIMKKLDPLIEKRKFSLALKTLYSLIFEKSERQIAYIKDMIYNIAFTKDMNIVSFYDTLDILYTTLKNAGNVVSDETKLIDLHKMIRIGDSEELKQTLDMIETFDHDYTKTKEILKLKLKNKNYERIKTNEFDEVSKGEYEKARQVEFNDRIKFPTCEHCGGKHNGKCFKIMSDEEYDIAQREIRERRERRSQTINEPNEKEINILKSKFDVLQNKLMENQEHSRKTSVDERQRFLEYIDYNEKEVEDED